MWPRSNQWEYALLGKKFQQKNTLIIDIYSMTAVRSGNDINYNLFLIAVSAASLLSCQREWSSKYAADTSWGGMKWPAWQTTKKVHFLWNSTHLKWVLNEKSVWLYPIDEHSTRRKWPGVPSCKFQLKKQMVRPFCLQLFRKYGLWFKVMELSTLFCLLNWFEHTLQRFVLQPNQILSFYIYAQNFHPGGFCKWYAPLDFEGL